MNLTFIFSVEVGLVGEFVFKDWGSVVIYNELSYSVIVISCF